MASGKPLSGFDLPAKSLVPVEMELLRRQRRRRDHRPREARRSGAALRVSLRRRRKTGRQGRSRDRVRPPARRRDRAAPSCWSRSRASSGRKGAEATFTVAPYDVTTLAPAGKPRVHKVDVTGELKPPGVRFIGFFDGYTRVFSERPGDYDKKADVRQQSKMAIIDAISGKVEKEGPIADVVGLGADRTAQAAAPRPVGVRRAQ